MPSRTSRADFTSDWEKLVTNLLANAAELPDLTDQRIALENALEEVKAGDARQQARRGEQKQATKELHAKEKEGKQLASKLRAALKSHYGFSSPRLIDFGILPLGLKKRRQPGEPEEPEPEDSAQTPPGVQPAPQKPDPSPQKS